MNFADRKKKTLASRMQHYVYIQSLTRTADGEGGFTQGWTTGSTPIPAEVRPYFASQVFENKSVNVEATHWITIRGNITVNEKTNRFYFDSRIFEILYIENTFEENVEQVCTCKELR